ncbi:MAG: pteridine reductase [Gammaproteobacteria bacterium]|nr:pteridine reductase [Gammaproteobacteria bacterium]
MEKSALTGSVALVTGAARRIGAEIARTLHGMGMDLAVHYHVSECEALGLVESFNRIRKGSAIAVKADLNEPQSEKALIQQVVAHWHRLDVLVNNASRFFRTPVAEVDEAAWNDLMNSNLKAPFFLSQAAAPHLALNHGVIINITDVHAERPMMGYPIYSIAKAGLAYMTKVLAIELGPNIRVNAVAPGSIIWPEGENSLSEEAKQKIIDRTALQKVGCEKDIAKAVLFLIKDAPFITGQIIAVDGGRTI